MLALSYDSIDGLRLVTVKLGYVSSFFESFEDVLWEWVEQFAYRASTVSEVWAVCDQSYAPYSGSFFSMLCSAAI